MDKKTDHDQRSPVDSKSETLGYLNRQSSLLMTINGGSSSLKFALYEATTPSIRRLFGRVDRIGLNGTRWVLAQADGGLSESRPVVARDLKSAAGLMIDWLERSIGFAKIAAIGHRIVHGGSHYHLPERIDSVLIEELRKNCSCDPDHLPGEIELIETFRNRWPDVLQVACFDTAFHHEMPRVAQIVPIPRRFETLGVRRYGFHGLSYEYLVEELTRTASPEEAQGRLILAHLGSGASLAAVKGGCSVDTTMGFTPASGLVMGTRTGDLDPGLVKFLSRIEEISPDQFDNLVNHQSGLLGVSGTSSDVRDLLRQQSRDINAAEAIELFCYQVKKGIGAFSAVLRGLDTLVFAGGIGENSAEIRRRICEGLGFLGIDVDEGRNESNDFLISTDASSVKVRVIRTDEELMIAKSVSRILDSAAIPKV